MANNNDMLIRMVMAGDASPFLKEVVAAEQKFGSALQGMSATAAKMDLLGKAQESAKKASAEFFKLKKESEAYQKAIAMATGPTKDLEKALATTDKALVSAEKSMRRQIDSVQGLRKELKAAGVDTWNLATAQADMVAKIDSARARLVPRQKMNRAKEILGLGDDDPGRNLQLAQAAYNRLINSGQLNYGEQVEAARAFQAKIREVRGELAAPAGTGFLSGVRGEIIGTVAALGSLTGAVQATMSVLNKTGAFETLQVQLNSVEKSAVLGAHAFKQLKQLALDTPFGVQGLTQTYSQLKNFGLDPMAGALQAVTDQSAKLGGNQETLTRISLALGQAWSKQKLQGEEALQFVEAGVPVWDLLGKKLNRTAAELQDMSSKGLLGRDVIRQLIQAMQEDAKGAAASQVGTWQGMVSQLQDIWDQYLAEIGNSGPLEAAKAQVKALMDAIAQAMADGSAADMGRNLAAIISGLGEAIRVTIGFVREHADAIKLLIGSYVGMKVLVQVVQWVGALSAALNTLLAMGSAKMALGVVFDSAGIAGAIAEMGLLKGAIAALPISAVAAFSALGLAAAAGIKVAMDHIDRWSEQQERALHLSKQILQQFKEGITEAQVLDSATLNSLGREQLAQYEDTLKRALKTKQLMLQQRAESVERGGGDATQDAEARRLAREAAAYSKALADYKAYTENRVKEEERFGKNVDAVRNGALAGLAEKLAKEQKLYDKANDALKAAVEARKKHQEAWYGNKAVDPAKKAKDPATMGVTDYYEGMLKANALGRKVQESQAKAAKTGKDSDFRQAARDAAATEKAFESLMDTINKLREAGKITEGEFNFFNDQAGRSQDGFDAKAEGQATDQLQQAMQKIEELKKAADSVKRLQIGFDSEKGNLDLDNLIARFQAAADAKPIKIPVQYVGQDGKYLTDARKDVGLPEKPPGFSGGGWTGSGGKYEPAGVVHGGEFVQTQERMREPGALAFMWDFHRRGMGALQDWRGYANGGLVGAALPTFADRISLPDVGGLAQPAAKALGTLLLQVGGRQLSVQADPSEAGDFMADMRRLQLKM